MAGRRAGEHRVVSGVGMAGGAHRVRFAMRHGEERVITSRQGRREPGGSRVASGAGSGPARCHVIRICCSGKVLGVAGVAIGGRACEYVANVA